MEQQIRFCRISDGVRVAYTTSGAGPPVVRALGWLTHLEFEEQGPIWRTWHEGFAGRYTFVRYDGRGVGLSDRDVTDLSLDAKLRDLEGVVDALRLDRFALVGTSDGAATAIAYAARHPDRVGHLVAYGATAYREPTPEEVENWAAFQTIIRTGWGQDHPLARQFFTNMFFPDADEEFVRWHTELQRVSATPDVAAVYMTASVKIDVRDLLPDVTVPTLVIHRRGDFTTPFEHGRALAASIPGARFVALEGRNHLPLPGEPESALLIRAITDFIREAPAAAGVPGNVPDNPDGLSPREVQILRLIAIGKTNREIAEWLMISPNTVIRHVSNIFDKTGVANRAEAATYANRHGLVE